MNIKFNIYKVAAYAAIFVLSIAPSFSIGGNISDDCNDSRCGTWPRSRMDKSKTKIQGDGRPDLQKAQSSPSGFFLIHYDITGRNAVPLEDKDHNGVPDYVDSLAINFDYVYKVEVEEMVYLAPAKDEGKGGSDQYDVYLTEMGNNLIGEDARGYYGQTVSDGQFGVTKEFIRYLSFIEMDNNFSSKDSVRELDQFGEVRSRPAYKEYGNMGAKITAAHEFHHAIQFMYGMDNVAGATLSELSSTYMESRVFPESRDFLQYVRSLFSHPDSFIFGDSQDTNGYRYCIFAMFLKQEYGDGVLRKMWELVGNDISTYKALDSSLVLVGSSLDKKWKEFLPWLYYTGGRSLPGMYFTHAQEFPELIFTAASDYEAPFTSLSGTLKNFEFRLLRFSFKGEGKNTDDTLDVAVTSTDVPSVVTQTNYYLYDYICSAGNISNPDAQYILGNRYKYKLTSSKGNVVVDYLIQRPGTLPVLIDFAFPNPFRVGRDAAMFIPAPNDAQIYDNAKIRVYNAELQKVYTKELKFNLMNKNLVLIINDKDVINDLSAGVYIYELEYKDNVTLGKFAVINQK